MEEASAGVAGIEADLATTEASIAAQYEEEVTNALAAWQAAESSAWDGYQTALASLPGAPPLTERIAAPPAVEQTLALQLQPQAQAQPRRPRGVISIRPGSGSGAMGTEIMVTMARDFDANA